MMIDGVILDLLVVMTGIRTMLVRSTDILSIILCPPSPRVKMVEIVNERKRTLYIITLAQALLSTAPNDR